MPKKNNSSRKSTSPAKKIVSAAKRVVTKTVTEVRNTPIPKIAKKAVAPRIVTHDDIARRAYEIYTSGTGGSEADNWYRAERELRGL